MTLVYGWWDWNAEASSLNNRVTGERVVYRGPVEVEAPSSSGFWLRFDYIHPELTFPLLVEEIAPSGKSNGTLWRLDYCHSSELWREESNGDAACPPYGVWRRIDDCVSDALASWPETKGAKLFDMVDLDGGWLNGAWNEHFTRSKQRCRIRDRAQTPDEEFSTWLIPLDTPPPSPFVFHDYVPRRDGSENWDIENPVLLEGLEFDNPRDRYRPHLPPDKPLTGLDGRTAYMLSRDARRLLYPFHGDTAQTDRLRHSSAQLSLLYVDDRIVWSVAAFSKGRTQSDAYWNLVLGNNCSVRTGSSDPEFFVARPERAPSQPSRAMSLQTEWGVVDGWCNWPGTKIRHSAWLSHLNLLTTKALVLASRYQGGRPGTHSTTFTSKNAHGSTRGAQS
jgi:hypothetical protein